MENKDLARTLYETADLMEIAGEDGFRIRSYRNGAGAIESHPERVEDILSGQKERVRAVLEENRDVHAALKDALLDRDELIGAEILEVIERSLARRA